MKKIKMILIMLTIFLTSSNLFAQNTSEVEDMPYISTSEKGIETLLKIQLQLNEMVEIGNEIVQEVTINSNISRESEQGVRMEYLIFALEELQFEAEIAAQRYEEELNSTNQRQEFIRDEIRSEAYMYIQEAREISKEFRTIVHSSVNEERKDQIKQRAQERAQTLIDRRSANREELVQAIEEKRKEHLVKKIEELGNSVGAQGVSEIAKNYAAGEISKEEFRSSISQNIDEQNLGSEIRQRMSEEKETRANFQEQIKNRVMDRIQQRVEDNMQRREERIQDRLEEISARVQQNQGGIQE